MLVFGLVLLSSGYGAGGVGVDVGVTVVVGICVIAGRGGYVVGVDGGVAGVGVGRCVVEDGVVVAGLLVLAFGGVVINGDIVAVHVDIMGGYAVCLRWCIMV